MAMICCYSSAQNDPYKDNHHPRYTKLEVVPDTAIKEVGVRCFADDSSKAVWKTSGIPREIIVDGRKRMKATNPEVSWHQLLSWF